MVRPRLAMPAVIAVAVIAVLAGLGLRTFGSAPVSATSRPGSGIPGTSVAVKAKK